MTVENALNSSSRHCIYTLTMDELVKKMKECSFNFFLEAQSLKTSTEEPFCKKIVLLVLSDECFTSFSRPSQKTTRLGRADE